MRCNAFQEKLGTTSGKEDDVEKAAVDADAVEEEEEEEGGGEGTTGGPRDGINPLVPSDEARTNVAAKAFI
jgi:hypothetical protein